MLAQIRANPELQPARSVRDSGIAAVLLMDAQIDHVTGLLMLCERASPLLLLATPEVLLDIGEGFPITRILSHYCGIQALPLQPDGSLQVVPGLPGLAVLPIVLSSKPPPCSPFRHCPRPGDNIGLVIENLENGARVFYAPGLGEVTPELLDLMAQCQIVLVDGTFWTEDEMQRLGLSKKSAAEMCHLPQSGTHGMISQLDQLPPGVQKILIHINNTNPILQEDSAERSLLAEHGIEVAWDGIDLVF